MAQINLNEDEARRLAEILDSYLSDLRMEMAGTDRLDYRDRLREREVLLKRVIKDLQAQNA